ncbi:MAG: ferritin-like domain-containing protein [Alphaproteobacteria bacterium]
MGHWTIDDIAWRRFDPALVDPDMIKLAKAASVVERNGIAYARYLGDVFHDDPEFQVLANGWAEEEVQHGRALARWAALADPGFDFEGSFRRFADTIRLPIGISRSVRGSRVGELVARCIVEVGTSMYYSALGAAAREPVLKEICRRIAADELRHYKMFYAHLRRYVERERIAPWRRLWVAIRRIGEVGDDELAFAYYAANHSGDGPYLRRRYRGAFKRRAYGHYRCGHWERAVAMILKAAGIRPRDWLTIGLGRLSHWFVRSQVWRHARAGA